MLSHRKLNCHFCYHSIFITVMVNCQKENVNSFLKNCDKELFLMIKFYSSHSNFQLPLQIMLTPSIPLALKYIIYKIYVYSSFIFIILLSLLTPCFGIHWCFASPVIYHTLHRSEVLDIKPFSLSIYVGSTLNVFKMLF